VSTATMPETTFAAAVGCIDGRIHPALTRFVAAEHGVDAVDLVTEPGVDGALASGDEAVLRDVLRRLVPSREAHACRTVIVAGHEDCAAMPGSLDVHRTAVACAARRLADELGGTPVQGVVVLLDGTVELVETAGSCA
jgi:carbonic anhydrase